MAALAFVLLDGSARAQARTPPDSPLTCGAYEAVPSRIEPADPSGDWSTYWPNRLRIERQGRVLREIADWGITRVECADLNGDKTFELLVSSYSGAAHCCETLHVWTMDAAEPREILVYQAGDASGFELRDLGGDRRKELVLGDPSFAYYHDICFACSPILPIVACLSNKGFQDCTVRFPTYLRREMSRFQDQLKVELRMHPRTLDYAKGSALGVFALASLLGDEDQALETIRRTVKNDEVMTWLARARPDVREWMLRRGQRIEDANR